MLYVADCKAEQPAVRKLHSSQKTASSAVPMVRAVAEFSLLPNLSSCGTSAVTSVVKSATKSVCSDCKPETAALSGDDARLGNSTFFSLTKAECSFTMPGIRRCRVGCGKMVEARADTLAVISLMRVRMLQSHCCCAAAIVLLGSTECNPGPAVDGGKRACKRSVGFN